MHLMMNYEGTVVPSFILNASRNDVRESINGYCVLTEGTVPLSWVIYVRGNAH